MQKKNKMLKLEYGIVCLTSNYNYNYLLLLLLVLVIFQLTHFQTQ